MKMENDDVIELGSSDDEAGPPAPKKIKPLSNAMVHIPIEFNSVTIKPTSTNISKGSRKSIPVARVYNSPVTNLVKNVQKDRINGIHLQKSSSQRIYRKFNTNKTGLVQNKVIINPVNVLNRTPSLTQTNPASFRFGKCHMKVQGTPKLLSTLPPSITVKRSHGGSSGIPTADNARVRVNKKMAINPSTNLKKGIHPAGCIGDILTVELDDDENSQSSVGTRSPQWYLRPEEQLSESDHEKQNNKEPDTVNMVEITIDDSPVKPCTLKKRKNTTDNLSIMIEDSPIKTLEEPCHEVKSGSDTEPDKPKSPHSKKKLDYTKREECVTSNKVEIEIDINGHVYPTPEENLETDVSIDNKSEKNISEIDSVDSKMESIIENKAGEVKDQKEAQQAIEADKEDVSTNINQPLIPITDLIKTDAKTNILNDNKVKLSGNDVESSNINGEFHPTFQKFMDLCLELDNSDDMKRIIDKRIITYSRQVPKEYIESEEFLDMVSTKITLAKSAEPSIIYLYIKDIVDELNLQRKRAKALTLIKNDSIEGTEDDYCKYDPKRRRQIRRLQKTLKKLHRAIQKLDEQEVDFDDEEDSVYLLNDRYKERFIRVHEKLCQLTDTSMPSEPRIVIDCRPGQPTGPAKKLEKWINKKVPIGTPLPFPDFHDVVKCVREANAQDKLGWSEADIKDEARDLFARCGKKLQRRRQENEWRVAFSCITQDIDPADNNELLRKKLEQNREIGITKEAEILNRYAKKQNQLQLEAKEVGDKEADESPVESDDEEDESYDLLKDRQKRKDRLRRLLEDNSKKCENDAELQANSENTKEPVAISLGSENEVDNIEPINSGAPKLRDEIKIKSRVESVTQDPTVECVSNNNDETKDSTVKENVPVKVIDDLSEEEMSLGNVEVEDSKSVNKIDSLDVSADVQSESKHCDDEQTNLRSDDTDGDELNLLEKLNSGPETSSPESLDDEDSPISISDTESNGEADYYESADVISIANSSSSDAEMTNPENNFQNKCAPTSDKIAVCDFVDDIRIVDSTDLVVEVEKKKNDEDVGNVLLASSEDEDCTTKDVNMSKNGNYVNLQDDAISISETLVTGVEEEVSLDRGVEFNKCGIDYFNHKTDVMSISESSTDVIENEEGGNQNINIESINNYVESKKNRDIIEDMNKDVNYDNCDSDYANHNKNAQIIRKSLIDDIEKEENLKENLDIESVHNCVDINDVPFSNCEIFTHKIEEKNNLSKNEVISICTHEKEDEGKNTGINKEVSSKKNDNNDCNLIDVASPTSHTLIDRIVNVDSTKNKADIDISVNTYVECKDEVRSKNIEKDNSPDRNVDSGSSHEHIIGKDIEKSISEKLIDKVENTNSNKDVLLNKVDSGHINFKDDTALSSEALKDVIIDESNAKIDTHNDKSDNEYVEMSTSITCEDKDKNKDSNNKNEVFNNCDNSHVQIEYCKLSHNKTLIDNVENNNSAHKNLIYDKNDHDYKNRHTLSKDKVSTDENSDSNKFHHNNIKIRADAMTLYRTLTDDFDCENVDSNKENNENCITAPTDRTASCKILVDDNENKNQDAASNYEIPRSSHLTKEISDCPIHDEGIQENEMQPIIITDHQEIAVLGEPKPIDSMQDVALEASGRSNVNVSSTNESLSTCSEKSLRSKFKSVEKMLEEMFS